MSKLNIKRRKPSSIQLDSTHLIHFMKELDKQELDIHSLIVYKNDAIIAEAAKAPYALDVPHMSFSQAKAFITTALGFLYDQNKIKLDDLVIDYFPEYKQQTLLNQMTIKDALMMSTGHERPMFGADFRELESQWLSAFMSVPFHKKAGEQLLYNSGTSYLLSALIQKVTGVNVCTFLEKTLFEPLGIKKLFWEESPEGINAGGWGLYLTAEDMLRLGILYLQKGKWDGRQLLSEDWVKQATALQIKADEETSSLSSRGYGYHIWIGDEGVFRMDGAYGQICVIDPIAQSIVVIHAGTLVLEKLRMVVYTQLLPKLRVTIDEHFKDGELYRQHDIRLEHYIQNWTYKQKDYPALHRKDSIQLEGTYKVTSTNTAIYLVQLSIYAYNGKLVMEDPRGRHTIEFGIGHYVNSITTLQSNLHDHYKWESCLISCMAYWNQQDKLLLTCRYLDKPYVDYFTISLTASNLLIERTVNINSVALKQEQIYASQLN